MKYGEEGKATQNDEGLMKFGKGDGVARFQNG